MFHLDQNKDLHFEKLSSRNILLLTKLSKVHALDSQEWSPSMVSHPNFSSEINHAIQKASFLVRNSIITQKSNGT